MSYFRRVAAELLVSLGVVLITLSAVLSVARRALLFPDNFADHLASSLEDPRVAAFAADRIADGVLKANPDLTAFRPLIVATARGAVGTESFQALVRTAARSAHVSLFSERGQRVILSVPDAGVLLKSALANANPALAQKVPRQVQGIAASMGESQVERFVVRLSRVARRSAWLTLALFLCGSALALGGLALASRHRRALVRLGLDLLVAGVILLLLMPAGRALAGALPHGELARNAARGLFDHFAGALRTWGFVLGGIGLVLQAAGHSLLERFDPRESGRRLLAWVETPPGGARARLIRGLVLLAAGALTIAWPTVAVSAVTVLVGGGLAFVGLREVFEIALRAAPPPGAAAAATAGPSARVRVALVLALAAAFVAAIAWIGRPPAAVTRLESGACNGAPSLCARRPDEVVFPATHNAMSAVDIPGWLFPQQEKSIPTQLEDGIRALLFDVHYGIRVAGYIKTDLASDIGSRDKFDKAVGKEGIDAAMRIRDRLAGQAEGPRGLYLCHGFCELGAFPLVDAFRAVHDFLVRNPNEVLVFGIEDYVTPQDLAAAFVESGLDGLVYRGAAGPPWPTLRELIDSRQRVLVLLESGRKGVPWLHPFFEGLVQETPYRFLHPSEMSCAPNRGGTSGSFFLMNNWIETTPSPKPSNAAIVNAYGALLARARQCQEERGRLPNLLAVDFYRTGDLFRVARTLNGVAQPPG
jgi:uncharacterized membrane protein HdeD (DUF308 family)